jgi:hypothetical protein
LDLLDSYLSVYPDREESFLFANENVAFFLSPAVVRSRAQRYSLVQDPADPSAHLVRSYNAISTPMDADYPADRTNALNAIYSDPNLLADSGAGNFYQRARDYSVFKVSPLSKLLLLGVLKFSTLDPYGMGVEMEGGKPGWNDAMNGLPGLLGSGMPETFEMLRILRYVQRALAKYPSREVGVSEEFAEFLQELDAALNVFEGSSKDANAEHVYWDASNSAREKYRSRVVSTFSGTKVALKGDYLTSLLTRMDNKVSRGVTNALTTTSSGLSPTYFYYECSNYSTTTNTGKDEVTALSFDQKTLPLFLEGPTRHLKVVDSKDKRREIYELVRASSMYDHGLKMYTLCESLASMGQDLGRMKAFSPGWLENQSVWLHMSYKFYLELLRGGLYEEFFKEIRTGLVPFMDHSIYGRSPLEAASFIVSSAFPDKSLHGASFAARLSGSTAEFLSMWATMFAGHRPFSYSNNALTLQLHPILPAWLFDADNKASFTFLGSINVTYVNPSRQDSWLLSVKRYRLRDAAEQEVVVDGDFLSEKYAKLVRDRVVTSIIVEM